MRFNVFWLMLQRPGGSGIQSRPVQFIRVGLYAGISLPAALDKIAHFLCHGFGCDPELLVKRFGRGRRAEPMHSDKARLLALAALSEQPSVVRQT